MLDTETQLTSTPPYHLNQFIYHITTSSSITVHSSQVKTPSCNHRVQFAALLLAAAVALLLLRADTDFPLVSHPDSVEESLVETIKNNSPKLFFYVFILPISVPPWSMEV